MNKLEIALRNIFWAFKRNSSKTLKIFCFRHKWEHYSYLLGAGTPLTETLECKKCGRTKYHILTKEETEEWIKENNIKLK